MPELSDIRREEFCQNLVSGMTQIDAYVAAGFEKNRGASWRMTQREDVAARTAELRAERAAARKANLPAAPEPVPLVPTCDNPQTMAEMGFSRTWIADAYRRIAAAAEEAGQFSAATTAVSKIQGMVEHEQKDTPDAPPDKTRVDIDALGSVLDKVAGLIAASKAPDHSTADAVTYQTTKAHSAAESEV